MTTTTTEKNAFIVNFSRGEQNCEPAGTFSSLEEAVDFAKGEAQCFKGHPDFRGGFFEVWEHGDPDEGHFRHESIFVAR
jgi:hypothetical protein